MGQPIHVAVAAIFNGENEVLTSLRPDDVHLGGYWEFPGGKVEPGESVKQALERECSEELGIQILRSRPLIKVRHSYPEKTVLLDVWKVEEFEGKPVGNEGQRLSWCAIQEIDKEQLPEADAPIVKALNLPDICMITGDFVSVDDFKERIERAISRGIKLLQMRITRQHYLQHGFEVCSMVAEQTRDLCEKNEVEMVINSPEDIYRKTDNRHLNSKRLMEINNRPECRLLSASCHTFEELEKAQELDVDFVMLSPVNLTSSHPDAKPIGWRKFSQLVESINTPVYALGGVGVSDLEDAWYAGAQGVSGIGQFWND